MASIGDLTVNIRLVPDSKTMDVILKLLDFWQEDNPKQMIVRAGDHYRIVNKTGGEKNG